ncbi:6703_t:CDS:2 [Ambispora leptoticha]|uniref:RING-type E3 ubiquitin transferase n=1 Tax=Ambispora leptoticha TaxID=144679 RepID=A0A9N8YVU0_9GLOM|nr:6703_t:CDS:2 [Ambispora leptoticha]
MYIKAKAPSFNKEATIQVTPKLDIADLRSLISQELGTDEFPINRLRLLYAGKQLEDGLNVHQYDIKHEHTILVTLKALPIEEETSLSSTISTEFAATSQEPIIASSSSSVVENKAAASINENAPEDLQNAIQAIEEEEEYFCNKCKNNAKKKCKECGCHICGGKDDEEHTVVCDECNYVFHWKCLDPVMTELPTDNWFCEDCTHDDKEVVTAGKKLDLSKSKKSKMPSATTQRNWGGGMACVGRSKECTIVSKDHRGKIPGVPVGSSWLYRIHCAETGVHRPHVAGIAGTSQTGAVSIVLGGGYPEDEDNGEEFTYTGSGGRDLSGNKRTAKQTSDQVLTSYNLALAKTCNAAVNDVKGATAKDWKKSQPIRVVRGEKLKKHNPKYAPEQGYRYDGIYKLVKYWKETGSTGFIVWRYLMRRDDPEPAPWTKEGKRRIQELGLEMYVPENKRKLEEGESSSLASSKKAKKVKTRYTPSKELKSFIKQDKKNQRAWKLVLESETYTELEFIEAIQREFCCPICQELAKLPVTTECEHNICASCLVHSIKCTGLFCPSCRHDLKESINEKEVNKAVNEELIEAIRVLIPDYEGPSSHSSKTKRYLQLEIVSLSLSRSNIAF